MSSHPWLQLLEGAKFLTTCQEGSKGPLLTPQLHTSQADCTPVTNTGQGWMSLSSIPVQPLALRPFPATTRPPHSCLGSASLPLQGKLPPTPALSLPFHSSAHPLPIPRALPCPYVSFPAGHPEDEVTSTDCHHPQPAALSVPEPTLWRHCFYCLASPLPGVSLCSPTRGHAALQLGAIQLCAHLQFPQNMSRGEAGRAGLHRPVLGPREPQLHTGLQSPSDPPAFA